MNLQSRPRSWLHCSEICVSCAQACDVRAFNGCSQPWDGMWAHIDEGLLRLQLLPRSRRSACVCRVRARSTAELASASELRCLLELRDLRNQILKCRANMGANLTDCPQIVMAVLLRHYHLDAKSVYTGGCCLESRIQIRKVLRFTCWNTHWGTSIPEQLGHLEPQNGRRLQVNCATMSLKTNSAIPPPYFSENPHVKSCKDMAVSEIARGGGYLGVLTLRES